MRIKIGSHDVDLRPFIAATLAWWVVSIALIFALAGDRTAALRSWTIYSGLALTDLFFLVKTVAATLLLMSDQVAENRTAYAIQAFIYGSLKLLCLGAIGISLWKIPNVSNLGLLLGLGGLVVIPLGGGFWWSQSQLKRETKALPAAERI